MPPTQPPERVGFPVGRENELSRRAFWAVLGAIAILYVATCFTPVIFDDNEGLYAGAVREMHQRGDWLTPWSNGFPRIQKPPLVYWTMLVSTTLFGENEFALRLPNALATVGWIMATSLLARRLGGEHFGMASALVLSSMLGVWVFNHLVQPEPFLACFISLSIWSMAEARFCPQPKTGARWYLFFWIFLALGTMSKGLHGALWPLGVVGLTALFIPTWRPWLRPVLAARGTLLFALIVLPWYAYMTWHWPGFLSAHFLNEQLGATLNRRFPADARQLSIVQFYGQHLLFWLPWTLLIPGAIHASVRAVKAETQRDGIFSNAQRDVAKMLAIWVALTLISVAFSTRQDYYSMSCWGTVALFLATPWIAIHSPVRLPRLYLVIPCVLIGGAGLLALALAAWVQSQLGHLGSATAAPTASRDTFFDAISGISPALWARFLALLEIFGVVMMVAGMISAALAWQRRGFAALALVSGAMAVPICLAAVGFTMMSPYFSLAENARAINREIKSQPGSLVACEALPNTASSLFYYLDARVHWVNAPFNNQYAQQVLGLGRDYYWSEDELREKWAGPQPLYLIVEEERLAYWQALLPGVRILNKSGTRAVLENR